MALKLSCSLFGPFNHKLLRSDHRISPSFFVQTFFKKSQPPTKDRSLRYLYTLQLYHRDALLTCIHSNPGIKSLHFHDSSSTYMFISSSSPGIPQKTFKGSIVGLTYHCNNYCITDVQTEDECSMYTQKNRMSQQ